VLATPGTVIINTSAMEASIQAVSPELICELRMTEGSVVEGAGVGRAQRPARPPVQQQLRLPLRAPPWPPADRPMPGAQTVPVERTGTTATM